MEPSQLTIRLETLCFLDLYFPLVKEGPSWIQELFFLPAKGGVLYMEPVV